MHLLDGSFELGGMHILLPTVSIEDVAVIMSFNVTFLPRNVVLFYTPEILLSLKIREVFIDEFLCLLLCKMQSILQGIFL